MQLKNVVAFSLNFKIFTKIVGKIGREQLSNWVKTPQVLHNRWFLNTFYLHFLLFPFGLKGYKKSFKNCAVNKKHNHFQHKYIRQYQQQQQQKHVNINFILFGYFDTWFIFICDNHAYFLMKRNENILKTFFSYVVLCSYLSYVCSYVMWLWSWDFMG